MAGAPSVTYDLGLRDYRRFSRYLNFRMFRGQVLRRMVVVVVLMLALPPLVVAAFSRGISSLPEIFAWTWPMLLGGAFAVVAISLTLGPEIGARRMLSVHTGGPKHLTLLPEGAHRKDNSGESTARWAAMKGIESTPHQVMFVLSKGTMAGSCIVIPRSAFGSPAEADAFVAEARRLWQAPQGSGL